MSATGDRGGEAGTTLTEALVVVTITALVSTLAFPAVIQGLAGAAFQQAVSGVRADLRIARAQALVSGQDVDVVVNPDGHGYGWTPGPQRVLLTGLSLAPAGGDVHFYPDGSSRGVALRLGDGRATVDFEIDPDIGVLRGTP